jgi:hypothetical protein
MYSILEVRSIQELMPVYRDRQHSVNINSALLYFVSCLLKLSMSMVCEHAHE